MSQLRIRVLAGSALMALGLGGCAGGAGDQAATPPPHQAPAAEMAITVLSSRPDLVTGGDALVGFSGVAPSQLKISLNGAPIDPGPLFGLRGRFVVTGLKTGSNWLAATAPNGASARVELVNHPSTGPVLSGPHLSPYECRTVESGLGEPTDSNCSAPQKIDWFYKSTSGNTFKPLADPKGPLPMDSVSTTTIDGKSVPYIVRVESGVINRSVYRIAMLADPRPRVMPANADAYPEWNNRLAVTFGGGCGTQYNQGANQPQAVLNDLYLSRGFAFMASTELVNQQHCNQVLQGETLMMLKEHFIETYGVPKWTVGTGGSGGAIQQMVITQMYPGLLDGLQPSLSFPDSSMQTADCGLLQNFWRSKDGKSWSERKKDAVAGYSNGTCGSWERSFVRTIQAAYADGCAVSDKSLVYEPKNNPKGIRCTTQEMRVNIYGKDPKTGFARRPIDNIGIQYGLKALNEKDISVDEFLTLNEKIGGNDIDGAFVSKRTVGDETAIKAIYASGTFNTFKHLDIVPIINYRGYTDTTTPGDIHDRHRDLTIRARLEKATGSSANQVIWVADRAPGQGQPAKVNLAPIALDVMTKWLDSMSADAAPLTPTKVVKHKPADAVDAYWAPDGQRVNEVASWDPDTSFNKTYPIHLEPRLVAGAPITNDIMKCALKPVDTADYKVTLSKAQQARLKKIFPGGVCDWSKPGVGYSMIKGSYQRY
jgi:hypothetical protein